MKPRQKRERIEEDTEGIDVEEREERAKAVSFRSHSTHPVFYYILRMYIGTVWQKSIRHEEGLTWRENRYKRERICQILHGAHIYNILYVYFRKELSSRENQTHAK